ncbi:MAG: VWA domain-containing protein [Pirellulales bacterium]|nr:VWA domain-containing protein [Pirellulales bacterium]
MRAAPHTAIPCAELDPQQKQRRGAVVVLVAICMVLLFGMVAFALDIGYIVNSQTELKRACDAGALAGAGELVNGGNGVAPTVSQYVGLNYVGNKKIPASDVHVDLGHWDRTARSFKVSNDRPSALKVKVERNNAPLFFARIFGQDNFNIEATSIATYQPRDIMLVLDYSASMNDDSELKSSLGTAAATANLQTIYQQLGSPKYGKMTWPTTTISSTNANTVLKDLGLDKLSYPFSKGSWSEYVDYTMNSITPSSYRKKYGYLTFMDYLLAKRPGSTETPTLWKTDEQPITALKNSVQVLLAYLQEKDTDDQVGLAVYTAADGTAKLESQLTKAYASVEKISRERQAGHYDQYTNIGAGMEKARVELQNRARQGSFRMMVLMTDGIANRPSNEKTAKALVLSEANKAAAARIPIVTISLGAGADTSLMQQVADITGSVHFNVPGNRPISEMEEDLKEVFQQVAADRPLLLVQ